MLLPAASWATLAGTLTVTGPVVVARTLKL